MLIGLHNIWIIFMLSSFIYITLNIYLVFLGFCWVFKFPFLDPDTTAACVDAIPDTVVAAIAAIPEPELTTFLFEVFAPTELLPLLS